MAAEKHGDVGCSISLAAQFATLYGPQDIGAEEPVVIGHEHLEWSRGLFARLTEDGTVPIPFLYPTANGGVRGEWSIGPWEAHVSSEPGPHLDIFAANVDTSAIEEAVIDAEAEDLDARVKAFLAPLLDANHEGRAISAEPRRAR
jgi:hypothetical protein